MLKQMRRGTWLAAATLLMAAVAGPALARPAAANPAAAKSDWLANIVATPEGGFRIGNPAARVKLIEYGSLTCSHCAHFHADSNAALRANLIATGKVSFEFRNFVLNGPDFAAALLARCQGPKAFFPMVDSFFTKQSAWTEPFARQTDVDAARLAALPPEKRIPAMAEIGKLDSFVAPLGISRARFDACLIDKTANDQLLMMRKDAVETWKLTGTPGFIINGRTQEGVMTWEALEPLLQAALR